ncbi:MAG: iron chelate uptake ABC transporter family permease subunit, partial [Actinobacteria bacterium]|nr:iron chelate uptake ABC transporter family permease subunit [Actinomycetota bacterium]
GLAYRREVIRMLVLVAVLISVSTTMVGPMTFFGFIVATLAYQLAGSSQHRVVLPFAVLLGMATLLTGYFVLRHVFYAAGMLSIIIEFAGGLFFLVYLLRKGAL